MRRQNAVMRNAKQTAALFVTMWMTAAPTQSFARESRFEIASNIMKASGAIAGAALFCGIAADHALPYWKVARQLAQRIDPTAPVDILNALHVAAVSDTQLAMIQQAKPPDCAFMLKQYTNSRKQFGLK